MIKDVAVVIPYYRNNLMITERISLDRCKKILGRYPLYFVTPSTLTVDRENLSPKIEIISVPTEWMSGIEAYNQMMLNIDFYRIFEAYQYILIYQLDAYVFSDRLMEFCLLGFDYIGAPWIEGKFDMEHEENGIVYVGNGGFSLRKVSSCISVLNRHREEQIDYNEDVFWGSQNSEIFKVAPVDVAIDFAFERPVRLLFEKNGKRLPFGCHAWMRYDFTFLKPYLISAGYHELEEYKPEREYDLHNQYIDKSFMQADEEEILSAISLFTDATPDKVYIYGAGKKGEVCGYLLRRLRGKKIEYLDRNKAKWGKEIFGFPILSPLSIKEDEQAIIIVTINQSFEVMEELTQKGFEIGKNLIKLDCLIDTINSVKAYGKK